MTEDERFVEEKLLKILEEAILEERNSTKRYQEGLALVREPEAVAMFKRLVADEQAHERVLKERYYAIKKRLGLKVMREDEPNGEH